MNLVEVVIDRFLMKESNQPFGGFLELAFKEGGERVWH